MHSTQKPLHIILEEVTVPELTHNDIQSMQKHSLKPPIFISITKMVSCLQELCMLLGCRVVPLAKLPQAICAY